MTYKGAYPDGQNGNPGLKPMNRAYLIIISSLLALATTVGCTTENARNPSPPGSPPLASGDKCNFWVGDVTTIQAGKRGSVAAPGHYTNETTYHVRLREGTRSSEVSFEVPLINVGSLVEGNEDEEVTGAKGDGTNGSYRTSGSGKAPVLNPGTNVGSVGHLYINNKGERVQYRFTMEPDWESRAFPVTTHGFRGDPPRPYVQEHTAGFYMVGIGQREDPESPGRITGGGLLMAGGYTIKDAEGNLAEKTSWKLRAEVAPCNRPPDLGGPPPAAPQPPKPPCDPDLQANADRKWQAAQDLFAAGAKHLAEASQAFHDWKVEEAKTMGEIGLEKNDLLKIVELALEEGGQHLLHAAAGWFGLATTAAWIYTDVAPHVREHDQAVRDAAKMTEAATKLADDAIQDLRKALAQDSACEEVRQKAIAHEKLLDQAKALREKWALDGSALYKENPQDPSTYPMNADAALNRAIQILSARSASSTASAPPPSSAQASQTVRALQSRAASPQGLTVTVGQARAALAEVDASIRMMSAGRDLLEKRNAFAESWSANLAALIAKWK